LVVRRLPKFRPSESKRDLYWDGNKKTWWRPQRLARYRAFGHQKQFVNFYIFNKKNKHNCSIIAKKKKYNPFYKDNYIRFYTKNINIKIKKKLKKLFIKKKIKQFYKKKFTIYSYLPKGVKIPQRAYEKGHWYERRKKTSTQPKANVKHTRTQRKILNKCRYIKSWSGLLKKKNFHNILTTIQDD